MIESIFVERSAKENLISEISMFPTKETGGVLTGSYDTGKIVIASASGPGPNAIHDIDEFIMDKEHMDKYLDEQYIRSEYRNIYVGEWHTHPQIHPEPSYQDIKSIYERSIEWENGEIVFLIIGFINFLPKKIKRQIIGLHYSNEIDKLKQLPVYFS